MATRRPSVHLPSRPPGPVRYAVVGLGYFAQAAVLPAFRHARGSRLAALVSDDATKLRSLSRRHKVGLTADYEGYTDLLDSGEVDAVYLTLPNDLHRDYTLLAAERGVHVLTEKPMAVTSEECEEMVAACERHKVRLMVAYRLHFEPANLAAADTIRRGRIGTPRYFDSAFSYGVKRGNIRTQRERGGGPVHDIGLYCVNAARYLFGAEPIDAVARAASRNDPRFDEVNETVSAILSFPGDRLAQFTVSFGAADCAYYTVVGTKGSVCVENAYEWTEPMTLETTIGKRTTTRRFAKRDQVAPEIEHFSQSIRAGRDPEPNGKEGLIDVRIMEAILEAANTGRRVPIGVPERERRPKPQMARSVRPPRRQTLVHAAPPH
jgi:predicted dehydrogenase